MNMIIVNIILVCSLLYLIKKVLTRRSLKHLLLVSVSHSHVNDTYLNLFLFFLLENNCLDKYLTIFEANNKTNRYGKYHRLTELTNHYKKRDILAMSFVWNNTNDGFNYWFNLNKKWNQYIIKNNTNDVVMLIDYIKKLNLK